MPITNTPPLRDSASSGAFSVRVRPDGTVEGEAPAGALIEVSNLTTLPTGFLPASDVVAVIRADAQGRFQTLIGDASGGDVLQVQLRGDDGAVQSALQLRVDADNRANDPRAAFVSARRLRVTVDGDQLTLEPRTSLPVTEPGATLRFTNTRTNTSIDVAVDPLGRFAPVKLAGAIGDVVDVAVSDEIALRAPVSVAQLTVEQKQISTPAAVNKDAPFVSLQTIPGRLFLEQLGLGKQGSIGDCPVPAGASAIAAVDPALVLDLIRDRGDGTFMVTFHPVGREPQEIVVDGRLFTRGGGRPIYGTGQEKDGGVELWFPLVEKAYAALVGSYQVLEQGTSVGQVMQDLLGRDNTALFLEGGPGVPAPSVDDVWRRMQRARADKRAMATGTYPSSESARYRGTGLYANHAYSVLGLEEIGGKRLVTMRNPWGGGAGFSGVFQLPIEDFCKLYQVLNIC